jgi:predicted protein tyrosine phosphatase
MKPCNVKIRVTDRETVEQGLVMHEPYVLISIRDPDKRRVRVPKSPLCRAILELVFHDAEPVPGFTPTDPITYMTKEDAKAIWRFVREHDGSYEAIVVHCEQGMSRSPSVAAALARELGVDEKKFWDDYMPYQPVE